MTRTRRLSVVGLLAAGVTAVLLVVLSGGSDGYEVRVELRDAAGLRENNSVKVAGVPGGKVTDLIVTKRDTAMVTLKLDPSVGPIGQGASVKVRPTDLLGERYAQVTLGDANRPQPSGSFIPMGRTSSAVELDDVLNMLDIDTRTRLGILINETGMALAGRGADFNKLLTQMPASLDDTRRLVAEIASQNRQLQQLIVRGDRVLGAANTRRDDLGALVRETGDALGVAAGRRRQLGATIRNAPAALTQLNTTLTDLRQTSKNARPFADELRATAAPLDSTLQEIPSLAKAASKTLKRATEVAPALQNLGHKATPRINALTPTTRNVVDILKHARPLFAEIDKSAMKQAIWFLQGWATQMNNRDALGHLIRAKVQISSAALDDALAAFLGGGGTKVESRTKKSVRKKAPKVALPSLTRSSEAKKPTPQAPAIGKVVTKTVEDVSKAVKDLLPRVTEGIRPKGLPGILPGGLSGKDAPRGASQPQPGSADALLLLNYLMGS